MRTISKKKLIETVKACCIEGATLLPDDVLQAMKNAEKVAFGLCGLLNFVSVIFAPFVWVLTKSQDVV